MRSPTPAAAARIAAQRTRLAAGEVVVDEHGPERVRADVRLSAVGSGCSRLPLRAVSCQRSLAHAGGRVGAARRRHSSAATRVCAGRRRLHVVFGPHFVVEEEQLTQLSAQVGGAGGGAGHAVQAAAREGRTVHAAQTRKGGARGDRQARSDIAPNYLDAK